MGSHFHDWNDYNGVAFSIQLLEWVAHFRDLRLRKFWQVDIGIFCNEKHEKIPGINKIDTVFSVAVVIFNNRHSSNHNLNINQLHNSPR